MTKEQEKMVLDNEKLIYVVLKRYKVKIEDYYDVAMIGLCKGVKTFDASKGNKPSTYLYRCISNELLMNFRVKNVKTISLETKTNKDNNLRVEDMLPDTRVNVEDDLIKNIELEALYKAIERLSENKRIIIEKTFFETKKTNQKEIASLLNVTQAQVSRLKRDALIELRKVLQDD